jgi:cytochrome b pre-mRNA-processing protein 3
VISFSRRKSVRVAAELAYSRVVEHARQPIFFTAFGVPDTLDGRFELICLHAFLYLHRLKSERPQSEAVSQAFFDAMFTDMDRGLREMGTGDLSVGRHVKRMAKGFYGRIRAYQDGLESDDTALAGAIARNLFGTVRESAVGIEAIVEYMRRAAGQLARQSGDDLSAGNLHFPTPAHAASDAAQGALAAGSR